MAAAGYAEGYNFRMGASVPVTCFALCDDLTASNESTARQYLNGVRTRAIALVAVFRGVSPQGTRSLTITLRQTQCSYHAHNLAIFRI